MNRALTEPIHKSGFLYVRVSKVVPTEVNYSVRRKWRDPVPFIEGNRGNRSRKCYDQVHAANELGVQGAKWNTAVEKAKKNG